MHPPTEPVSRFSKSLEILVTAKSRVFLKRETDVAMTRALDQLIRASNAVDRNRARNLGLTDIEARALTVAFERHGVGPSAMARALGITTSAVTAVIDRLCRKGYVRRTEQPGDRRRVELFLTYATTRKILEERTRLRRNAGIAADELTAHERRAVMQYLGTVAQLWRTGISPVNNKRHRVSAVPRSVTGDETT